MQTTVQPRNERGHKNNQGGTCRVVEQSTTRCTDERKKKPLSKRFKHESGKRKIKLS